MNARHLLTLAALTILKTAEAPQLMRGTLR